MDIKKAVERLKLITGDEREALLHTLCEDAARDIELRLNCEEDERERYAGQLCAATAALALYRLVILDAAQSPDSLTTGSVRAEYRYNQAQAKLYLEQCMRGISAIARDDSFYFGSVRA